MRCCPVTSYVEPVVLRAPTVPPAARSAVERAKVELDRALGGSKVSVERSTRERFGIDESDVEGLLPDVVVFAESATDIASTMRIAEECGVYVTPRAAGTGRTGGATCVGGGIGLVTTGMTGIKSIDTENLLAVVLPGTVLSEFQAIVEQEGLFYPPDPSSFDTCTLGGNVAENAGGPRAFKYGVTRDYVLGIEAVLMGGTSVRVGRRTTKGVVGYDVTSLLVGSEGTLAVFSELTLRLVAAPNELATMMATFDSVRDAAEAVRLIVLDGLVPRCLELLDDAALACMRADGAAVDASARAMLLIEIDGSSISPVVERMGNVLASVPGCREVLVAQDAAQRDRVWAARRNLSRSIRKTARYKLSEDVVVPRTEMVQLLDQTAISCKKLGVRHLAYGHAGDGNLHVNFLWDDESIRPHVDKAVDQLMRDTIALNGTLSGEHGIGVSKMQYLPLEQSSELIDLQRRVKCAFDPHGLLNPGKIFPKAGHGAC